MSVAPTSDEDLAFASAAELVALYARRDASPVDVARVMLDRIEQWNPLLNAYCHLTPERTMAEARASEARWLRGEELGPADGVPYGVKDLLLVEGCPTGFGSQAGRQLQPSESDAPAVARLREAGAVFLGKTNTSEYGWKGTADSLLNGVCPNVWDAGLTSGGSSGGAASAAAAGLGTFQLGTDGGGSTRIPAAFTGIAGMKGTFGRVAAWPPGPMLTLSNVGPMARAVSDLATLFGVIARPDPRDWNALPVPAPPLQERRTGLAQLRVGVHAGEDACDPRVLTVFRRAVEALAGEGALIEPVGLPLDGALALQKTHWEAGAAWLASQVPPQRQSMLDPGLQAAAARGARLTLTEYYRAMVHRQRFGEAMQRAVAAYDIVLTPTVPILPFEAGREAPADAPSQDWLDWNPFTFPLNLTRQPAVSILAGYHDSGLPVGLQLVAPLHEDDRLLSIAHWVERALNITARRPRIAKNHEN